jgi:hypothetical protein
MMWHKAQAQPSEGVASQQHHLGQPAMCWRISKNHFIHVSRRGGAQGIQCPKVVQGGNLAAQSSCMVGRPNKWAHTPNLPPQHRLTPPLNTMVLPLAESVKRVRFSPL